MFRVAKYLFYALVVGALVFAYWFMPKYSYVQKNPGFCTQLSKHLYYCGDGAEVSSFFNTQK
jgi:hypothetical protein